MSAFDPDIRAFAARAEAIAGLGQLPPPTLPGHIAAWIADRIQFGDFKPGEAIRELVIADHFDVSRGPVREALRLLDRGGLITLRGRKGAIVRELTLEETRSLFMIRAELFAAQAGLAASATAPDPTAIEAMTDGVELLMKLANAPEETDVGEYIMVRRGIATLIVGISQARYLANFSRAFEHEVAMLWASILRPERRRESASRWAGLCKAIANGRRGEAERLARDLVLESLAEIRRLTDKGEGSASAT